MSWEATATGPRQSVRLLHRKRQLPQCENPCYPRGQQGENCSGAQKRTGKQSRSERWLASVPLRGPGGKAWFPACSLLGAVETLRSGARQDLKGLQFLLFLPASVREVYSPLLPRTPATMFCAGAGPGEWAPLVRDQSL